VSAIEDRADHRPSLTPDLPDPRAGWRDAGEWMIQKRWPVTLTFAALIVASWELWGALDRLPRYILPPSEIVVALVEYLNDGTLGPAMVSSMQRLGMGFAIGTGLGVLIGLLSGVLRPVEDIADPIVSLTYPLPKIALFPAFAVWLGFTDRTRILIIALACFYPSFVNSLSGTRTIDRQLVWVARNLGAGRARTFFQVILPASLPRIVVGVRISLALSFVLLFSTEAIASREGLGHWVFEGYLNVRYDLMYAAILLLAILGFLADRIVLFIGDRLTRGHSIEAIGRG
jgi:ABC-type nitrate/sulfonate/bicarbonate transport system permease component